MHDFDDGTKTGALDLKQTDSFNIRSMPTPLLILLSILGVGLAFMGAFAPQLSGIVLIIVLLAIVSYHFPYFGIALNLNGTYLLTHTFAIAELESGILLSLRFIMIVSLIKISKEGNLRFPTEQKTNIVYILLGFLWLLLGVIYSDASGYGTLKALRYLAMNATVFMLPLFIRWSQVTFVSLLKGLTIVGAVAGWISLVFILYNGLNLSERVFLMEEVNVIWISRAMGISIISIFGLLILKQKDHITLFLLLSLPGLISSMLLSGSRGPILALVLALGAIVIFMERRKKSTIIYLIVGLIIMMSMGLMILYLTSSSIRLLTDPTQLDKDISALHRVIAWLKSFELIGQNLIAGIGTGGFRSVGNQLFPWLPTNIYAYPHNIFIEIWMENGIIGLLLLFFPIIKIAFWESRLNKLPSFHNQSIAFGLLVFAVINAQVGGDLTMNEGIWFSAGILAALSFSVEEKEFYTTSTIQETQDGYGQ